MSIAVTQAYRVEFKDVGANKLSWAVETDKWPDEVDIIRMVRARKALMSRGVDVMTDDSGSGFIFAGMRTVGTYSIAELEKPR